MIRTSRPLIDQLDRLDHLLVVVVFVATCAVLMATMGVGIPRDESFYIHAGFQYVRWFEELWRNIAAGTLGESFTKAGVDAHFSYNPEHPALMKALFGLSYRLFCEGLGWLSSTNAMRVPAVLFASSLSGFVFLFGRHIFGRTAGLLAVAFLLLQPRYFFHAHLACFDVPVVACWVAVVYAYWRSFESHGWGVLAGLFFGLALSVKLNSFFLPIVLGLHWLAVAGLQFRRSRRPPRFPWVFVWMGILGPALFLLLWPRHWFDTFARIEWYMRFHLKHVHYFVQYFGQNLQQPPLPISYPWVMTLVTVPATILLAAGIGTITWRARPSAADDRRGTGLLFAINVLFPIALISMPQTPIFGGTKHWMAAMPFVAVLAGGAVVVCGRALAIELVRALPVSSLGARGLAVGVIAATTVAPALIASVENHPLGTSYYNEIIGSYRGAADARMARHFWGYASRHSVEWLNENAPKGARVWTHDTTTLAWDQYRRDGIVRPDLRASGMHASSYGLYDQDKAFVYNLTALWESYGTRTPVHVVDVDGVPMLSVYERPAISREAGR